MDSDSSGKASKMSKPLKVYRRRELNDTRKVLGREQGKE